MKKVFVALLALGIVLPVYADFAPGDKTLTLFGGAGGSSTQYDYKPGNEEPVTNGGPSFGGQFLYYLKGTPAVAVGLDIASSLNKDRGDSDLLDGYDTNARVKTLVGLVIARLSYPRGPIRPYIFGGVGVHHSTQQLSAIPQAGFAFPDGSTGDKVLIDERTTSAALSGGIGVDFFATEALFFGLELRNTWLAGMTTDDNVALRAAGFTADHSHGTISEGNLFIRGGVKF